MIHLPDLITDLGFILITAGAVTLLFKYLKQPVVLGYIIAGILVGPHIPIVPTVTDTESITIWAEIGVIFLLFGLGLEFSFKKLVQVGKPASITATLEVVFMLGLGFLVGQAFDWSKMDSLFLGGILAISSTTIIVRAFEELGLKTKSFVSIVFGVLIVEDLFAILLLVLLSTMAVTQALSGSELIFSTLRLGFFLVIWFLVGIYLLPFFLKKVRAHLNDETTLIVSIGLCLMMVMIATQLGFSPALGAFIMGSLLAETQDGKRIEHLIVPVRDLFAAIFFVSVGMLINPIVIVEYWWVILVITVFTILGKFLSTGIGALLSGQSLKNSVQIGMSLAQIGEFSFIIATLGLTLGVISEHIYPIAVAVSAVTTFTTPYMIKYSVPFYEFIERYIPQAILSRFERYRSSLEGSSEESLFKTLWKAYGIKISLNSVIVVAIALGSNRLLLPYLERQMGTGLILSFITGLLVFLIASPFLWAIIFSGPSHSDERTQKTTERLRGLQFGIILFRALVGVALIGFVVSQFSSLLAVSGLLLLSSALLVVFLSRHAEPFYMSVEKDFIANLNDLQNISSTGARGPTPNLAPWDAALTELIVSQDSTVIGKSLQSSAIKERYGVTVALIERGHKRILAPMRDEILLPHDRLFVIGTEEQLEAVRELIEIPEVSPIPDNEEYGLESLLISENSSFAKKTIRDCGLREIIHGLIVGVEREGKRILNPDSALTLQPNDLIWTVGDRRLIKKLLHGELEVKL